jgi:Ras family protein A
MFHFQVEVNFDVSVDVEWHDTSGIEDYGHLRPLQYPDAHLFLVCFAIDSPDSLDNVQERVRDPS